jgi:hypothetical protein
MIGASHSGPTLYRAHSSGTAGACLGAMNGVLYSIHARLPSGMFFSHASHTLTKLNGPRERTANIRNPNHMRNTT